MVKIDPKGRMNRSIPWWILLLAVLVQGCASMDKSECQSADWKTIGYEDGARGAMASHIGKHREACARHSISPDLDTYRQGRAEGLRQYCRAANGYRLGEHGSGYAGVCPPDMEPEFLAAYTAGKRIHEIVSGIRSTQNRINSKEQELTGLKSTRKGMQAELLSKGVTTGRRAELLLEIVELNKDQDEVKNEISMLEYELEQQRETLSHTKATDPYR